MLNATGTTAKIADLLFADGEGPFFDCPGGGIGVWRIVGGVRVCDCDYLLPMALVETASNASVKNSNSRPEGGGILETSTGSSL